MAIPEGILHKLTHAEGHLERFKSEIGRYFGANPGAMVRDANSDMDAPTISFSLTKPLPPSLMMIAGDVMQNLRSTLDYLVEELVLAANNFPTKKNMFPICTTEADFKKAKHGGRLDGITPEALALIDTCQPYHAGEVDAPGQPLAVLNALTNINKHRRVMFAEPRAVPMDNFMKIPVGNELWGVPMSGFMPADASFGKNLTPAELQVHREMAVVIALDEECAKGAEITILLWAFFHYIKDDILPHFEKLF